MKNKKPSLTIIISDMCGGGTQRVLSQMMRAWIINGHSIKLITLLNSKDDFFTPPKEVERVKLDLSTQSYTWFSGIKNNIQRLVCIRKVIKSNLDSVVISFIGVTNILTIIAASFLNAKIVISERNDPSRQSLGLVWNILRKITYPFADVVTANSRNALVSLGNYIPSSKLILVPNPITLPTNVKFKKKRILSFSCWKAS